MNQQPAAPREFLATASAGTRVVVRYKIDGGFTDALGDLLGCSPTECTVRTRSADVVILLERVVAAKQVPPPPARRGSRT
ncbi:putative acetyltransferase [Arthrobacter sp. D1-17]